MNDKTFFTALCSLRDNRRAGFRRELTISEPGVQGMLDFLSETIPEAKKPHQRSFLTTAWSNCWMQLNDEDYFSPRRTRRPRSSEF